MGKTWNIRRRIRKKAGLAVHKSDRYSTGMMLLTRTGGVAMTNCYLIADEVARQAVLFDAPDHTTAPLLEEAAAHGWELIGLWLTHGHFDHFADHTVLRQRFPDAKILLHALDEAKAKRPDAQTRMFGIPFVIPPVKVDATLADNQKLRIGSLEVTVLHTPGHSPGHVVYYIPGEKVLVGGDLIIGGSIGRTDLPDSDRQQMEASIRRVMDLPAATRLLGGHGPATTLQVERQTNPFVQEILAAS
ncbi:MAG TPA: MBL fold metallo-hydrolase [Verrucomicrobiota bacterium]|nr:MBL fold metallo-hydrolase [Verrucomicrobiota bacterium]